MLATKCGVMQQNRNGEFGWQEELNRMSCKAALMSDYKMQMLAGLGLSLAISLNLYHLMCS